MSTNDSIWRLEIGGDKYLHLIPHDLNYFNKNFIGKPMPSDWSPPPITLSGKSKKLPDFVSWVIGAPVVSERARLALAPILEGCVQFLPFHELKGKPYYAMNVVQVEDGFLDIRKSEISYSSSEPRTALALKRAFFFEPLPHSTPPVFKVCITPGKELGDIFVTRAFAESAIAQEFTGIALADPREDRLKYVLDRKPQNVVPGIIQ